VQSHTVSAVMIEPAARQLTLPQYYRAGSCIILDIGPTKEVSAELAGLGTVSLRLG
jgi:hypothetical protein